MKPIKDGEVQSKEQIENNIKKAFNHGKKNIIAYQATCRNCQVQKMSRFLDFTEKQQKCKCKGFGVTELNKLKSRCNSWFCWETAREWDLCRSCYGAGFM